MQVNIDVATVGAETIATATIAAVRTKRRAPIRTFVVNPAGYVVFHVSSGQGGYVVRVGRLEHPEAAALRQHAARGRRSLRRDADPARQRTRSGTSPAKRAGRSWSPIRRWARRHTGRTSRSRSYAPRRRSGLRGSRSRLPRGSSIGSARRHGSQWSSSSPTTGKDAAREGPTASVLVPTRELDEAAERFPPARPHRNPSCEATTQCRQAGIRRAGPAAAGTPPLKSHS